MILKSKLLLPRAQSYVMSIHLYVQQIMPTIGQLISVPRGRFCAMGRCSSGGRLGFWGLVPKQAGGAQAVSPGSVSGQCPSHLLASGSLQVFMVTSQPMMQ